MSDEPDREKVAPGAAVFVRALKQLCDFGEGAPRGCGSDDARYAVAGARVLLRHAPATDLVDSLPWHRLLRRLRALALEVEPLSLSTDDCAIAEAIAEQALAGRHRFDLLEPFRVYAEPEPPPRRSSRLHLVQGGTP